MMLHPQMQQMQQMQQVQQMQHLQLGMGGMGGMGGPVCGPVPLLPTQQRVPTEWLYEIGPGGVQIMKTLNRKAKHWGGDLHMRPIDKNIKVHIYSYLLGSHQYPIGQLSSLSLTQIDQLGWILFNIQPNLKLETVELLGASLLKVVQFATDMR